ncbi:MAG: amino acid adenylation domain-containing protein [Oculatellaceae cyanobacterium Prado106]|jgi:amino acid adenylation domain-containing protein/thioester reductase-like protein|nr:amino acid adenylation domain-containing protein [Oculatellaceae cyanobacterium Prado106]
MSFQQATNSIHQLFEQQAAQTPDAIALVFQDQYLTYRELNERANQLAHYLQSLGVKPEVLVGVCVERSLEMVIALLGILKAGGAYVPLDPAYPQERLKFVLDDTQLPILITQTSLLETIPQHQGHTLQLNGSQPYEQQPLTNPVSEVQGNHLAYLIYTSGSTGVPKGVAIEHQNTTAFISWAKAFFTPEQLAGVLASTSLCFDLSIFELFVTLSCGGKVILAQNALQLPDLPAASEVTLINTVPSAIAALIRVNGIPTSVKTVNLAGEPLQNALVQKLYQLDHIEQVFNLYGPSEDTTYSTVALIPKGFDEIPPIGRPLPGTQIYLIEEPARRKEDPLNLAPIGVPGEIYIGGVGLAREYFKRPDLTAEKFIANPFSPDPQAKLYKTGDLAVYLPDGNLKCLGRIDHQVKIRGFRVELGDVEAALNQHDSVRDGTIIAREDTHGNKSLVAYVVPKTQSELDASNQFSEGKLQQWKDVWSATYSQSDNASDPTLNSTGWIDSFTDLPMPAHEVQIWVDTTVERILSLQPRHVLEIGCGMGMLLFRIAPHCESYFGMDISAEAIGNIQQQLQQKPHLSHVAVAQKTAHELGEFTLHQFDTVVINSVIQYFPDVDYLVQVMEQVTSLVKPGGQIFIGDVRNLNLLEAFHAGIQIRHIAASSTCGQLQKQIQARIAQDKELVLHPDFFRALQVHLPRISHIQTQLERGYSQDELTRFRSDVILHLETPVMQIAAPPILDWKQEDLSISKLRQFIQTEQPDRIRISGVPNSRFLAEIELADTLANVDPSTPIATLQQTLKLLSQNGVHPEAFWQLSHECSYHAYITWSEQGELGTYDIILRHLSIVEMEGERFALPELPLALRSWQTYANNPLRVDEKTTLVPQLRKFLQEKLPDYMVPSTFVLLENLPLTANGKIDRRALPDPKKERPVLSAAYVAPSTLLEEQLVSIWAQVLEIEQIGVHDNFFELGGHSLLTTQLLVQIEEAIQIKLPLFYLLKEPTILGLIKAINIVKGIHNPALVEETMAIVDLSAESVLDAAIQPAEAFNPLALEPEFIFLTGATGFLGAFLLHELLQQTQATIYCLVRAENVEAGRVRLQANLERYMLWSGELTSRIIPIVGDLALPSFGLTDEQFQELASQLDLIYHNGASVNLVYPYASLRSANVLGTREVLRLASQGKNTAVNFISTTDVFRSALATRIKTIREDQHLGSGQDLDKGYAQTKWVAEKLVMAAQLRGIPVCIYRPGMITGHSQTGVVQTNDLMSRIIKGMIQLESAPDLNQWVNMIPVDYASKAIVYLSRQQQSLGKTFHIVNPHTVLWSKLISEIRSFGYPIKLLSHEEWQAQLFKAADSYENALSPLLSLFIRDRSQQTQMTYLETFLMSSQSFDCLNTIDGLANTSIVCPPIDGKLLNTYFSYFIRSGFLPSPLPELNRQPQMTYANSCDAEISPITSSVSHSETNMR